VLVPDADQPVGKEVPVPKFWVYRLVTWDFDESKERESDITIKILRKKEILSSGNRIFLPFLAVRTSE
jgi:hypothetical protein